MWCCVGTAAAEERGREAKVYIWERAHEDGTVPEPVLKLRLLFADGKMLVHALAFFCVVHSDI